MAKTKPAARPRPSRQDGEPINRETTAVEESATTKLKRKPYEEELARLQLELIKLQEWIKHAGLKVVVIFEGRDAAGKGGTIKRITESLNPGSAGWWRWPPRPSASAPSGTSSAMCPTCPPPARSCSSTAAGTTGPGSSG